MALASGYGSDGGLGCGWGSRCCWGSAQPTGTDGVGLWVTDAVTEAGIVALEGVGFFGTAESSCSDAFTVQ